MADSPPLSPADVTAAQPRPWLPRYTLPPMPWAGMQFPGFNPIPNIGFPDMPFPFVRPFGAAKEKDEKGEKEAVDVAQEAQEQSMVMMTWWGMYIRASWEKLALQQQQQQQTALVEPDGPPPYSANPPETTVLATTHQWTPPRSLSRLKAEHRIPPQYTHTRQPVPTGGLITIPLPMVFQSTRSTSMDTARWCAGRGARRRTRCSFSSGSRCCSVCLSSPVRFHEVGS
jgi:hypothetical protein